MPICNVTLFNCGHAITLYMILLWLFSVTVYGAWLGFRLVGIRLSRFAGSPLYSTQQWLFKEFQWLRPLSPGFIILEPNRKLCERRAGWQKSARRLFWEPTRRRVSSLRKTLDPTLCCLPVPSSRFLRQLVSMLKYADRMGQWARLKSCGAGSRSQYSINRLVRYRIRREIGYRVGFRIVPIFLLYSNYRILWLPRDNSQGVSSHKAIRAFLGKLAMLGIIWYLI